MTGFSWQFGERFRTIRKMAKLNQDEFGLLLGVSRQTINAYENNRQRPPLDMMEKVCAKQDIAPLWLLSGLGEPLVATYAEIEGRDPMTRTADDVFTPEQNFLVEFIRSDRTRAHKLANFLMEQGLRSMEPGTKLEI